MNLYTTLIYQPIFNALVWIYNIIPGNDIGIAIIVLTFLIKIVLYPFTKKSLDSQRSLQDIQPKIKEIQIKYKDNQQVLAQELMKLYKEEKVSPFSSCLPVLIQLPVLIAVYKVFQSGLHSSGFELLYSFVKNPGTIDVMSFGFVDMAKPSIALAVFAGLSQYFQAKMNFAKKPAKVGGNEVAGSSDEKMMAMMNKQMMYMMPVLTTIIGVSLPAGLSLYWFVSTLIMIGQQWVIFKPKKIPEVEFITPVK